MSEKFKKGIYWLKSEIPIFAKKIAPVFALLNCGWREMGIPSKEQIEAELMNRLSEISKKESKFDQRKVTGWGISSGRLSVGFQQSKDSGLEFYLYFIYERAFYG